MEICRHGIVSGIIILPNFCPAVALLGCEKKALRWPGPFGSGFLSPQPPGVVGIGPVRSLVYPTLDQRELVLFLLGIAEQQRPSFRDAPLGAGPESILPNHGYGFRARALRARNDEVVGIFGSVKRRIRRAEHRARL